MDYLTKQARETIRQRFDLIGTISGYTRHTTIAGYMRHYFGDKEWGGDVCGCADDRCIGYHHDDSDECPCLPVLLDDYVQTITANR